MTPLESLMRQWQAAGTEGEKQLAAFRLTLPFDSPPELSPLSPAPGPAPPQPAYVSLCVHRDCNTGCALALCALGHGDREDGRRCTGLHCLESCPHRQRPTG